MEDLSARFLEYARLDRRRTEDGLTVAELERWSQLKRALTLHYSPGLDPREVDRRRSVRVPTRLRVRYASDRGFEESAITNLSRTGTFVQTLYPLPVGSPLRLLIEVEGDSEELEVGGEVVHSFGPPEGTKAAAPGASSAFGMGIRFTEVSPEAGKRLADLYERLIQREAAG